MSGTARWSAEDAEFVETHGHVFRKRTTIRAMQLDADAEVETTEGVLMVSSGFWLATDGKSIWPVSDEFMRDNYERAPIEVDDE